MVQCGCWKLITFTSTDEIVSDEAVRTLLLGKEYFRSPTDGGCGVSYHRSTDTSDSKTPVGENG